MHIDVLNRDVPVHEVFFVHNSAMQWNEVLNASYHRFIQCSTHTSNSIFSIMSPNEEFRKQGIETSRHLVSGVCMRINTNTES